MLLYQKEDWFDCKEEMKEFFPLHWEEVTSEHSLKLNLWWEEYDNIARSGCFYVITAREKESNKLVGYYWIIIKFHAHCKDTLTAFTDMYYLCKKVRKGYEGMRFLKFVENYLKELGVKMIITSTRIKSDKSALFERLNYRKEEILYTKILN